MKKFFADEWQSTSAKAKISLQWKHHVEINVNSTGTITITGIDAITGEEIILHSSPSHCFFKKPLEGFSELHIQSTKPYSYRLISNGRQTEEPHDDLPVPEKSEPTNILQQMRSVIRQELSSTREEFLENDTPFKGHEVEDDDDNFEEEQIAAYRKAMKEQSEKLNAKPEPKPEPEPEPKTDD